MDFAEKLPKFNGTAIATLQRIRRHQRKQAVVAQERAQPPDGAEISYDHLRLIELFPIEDYTRMERGLRALFPGDSFWGDRLADFNRTAIGLSNLGNTMLGYVSREKLFLPSEARVLKELPAEVDTIAIRLHKILPSAFAVTLDVSFTSSVTKQLRSLQSRCDLPMVKFRSWIPWGMRAISHSELPAETVHQQTVVAWLSELRGRIEGVLRPYVNGYFSGSRSVELPSLPAVEIFTIKGVPPKPEAFERWLDGASGWLNSLGATPIAISLYGFKSDDLLLLAKSGIDSDASARLGFVLDRNGTDNPDQGDLHLEVEEILDEALPFLVFTEFLDRTQVTIEELRRKVYVRLRGASGHRGLRVDFGLNRRIQRESMLLERFEVEMEQSAGFFRGHSLNKLHSIRTGDPAEGSPGLLDIFLERIKRHTQFIKKHLVLASDLFSDHLSWRNLDANYRLQRRLLLWTVVVSVATIVGLVLPNWQAIKRFLENFR